MDVSWGPQRLAGTMSRQVILHLSPRTTEAHFMEIHVLPLKPPQKQALRGCAAGPQVADVEYLAISGSDLYP